MLRALALVGALVLAAACGGRRDTAEIAAGVAPFDELAGIPFTVLRSGGARALRRNIEPVMNIGLRERIGAYEVTYAVPVFDSTSGSWPVEDALVLEIGATRTWPSDARARAEWLRIVANIAATTTTVPRCLARATAKDSIATLAEFDRGDSLTFGAEFVPGVVRPDASSDAAQTHLVIRRHALSAPAWTVAPCPST